MTRAKIFSGLTKNTHYLNILHESVKHREAKQKPVLTKSISLFEKIEQIVWQQHAWSEELDSVTARGLCMEPSEVRGQPGSQPYLLL